MAGRSVLPNTPQLNVIQQKSMLSLSLGDHDGKAASQGLFQLSKDDVCAFWKDDKLRAAIVPTDNIYIIGELGEGTIACLTNWYAYFYEV